MGEMNWVETVPTTEGWYWGTVATWLGFGADGHWVQITQIVYVKDYPYKDIKEGHKLGAFQFGSESPLGMEDFDYWIGPLQAPPPPS